MSRDPVTGFTYDLHSSDLCSMKCVYRVNDEKVVEIPNEGWLPMRPQGDITTAHLTTHLKSGKALTIDLLGDEHLALADYGRFDKLLSSIARGNMPGEALKRQLTKALDLPRLPKIKRLRMK